METKKEILERVDLLAAKIGTTIDVLAEKIGTTAEQIYPYLVRQQYVEVFAPTIWVIISVFVCTAMIHPCKYASKHWDDKEIEFKALMAFIALFLGAAFIVVGIVNLVFLIREIQDILNPEYAVLRDLVELLK